jgi:hypothetical protein
MNRPFAVLLACCVALPAVAQDDARDWDMHRDPRKKLLVAYTAYDNGIGLATRCVDGGFEAAIMGLPPAGDRSSRPLRIAFGDDDLDDTRWNVATNDTVAMSELPAPFARNLREGGRLRILIPEGAADGRNLLYDLTLPASSGSIDETLTTCGRPLVDPRDAELESLPENGLPPTLTWVSVPRPRYPAPMRYASGFAIATCITNPDGSLRDCAIETEHPRDGGFGEAALSAARRARVRNTADADGTVPTGRILFRTTFFVQGYQTPEEEEARRAQRRQNRERRSADRAANEE